jgi:hypothetical protein
MSHPHPDSADLADRRTRNRISVECPAELVLLSARLEGHIVDISPNGARLRVAEPPLPNSMGMLRWGNNEIYCTVIWANDAYCGLGFDRPLAGEIVAETILDHGETTQEVVAAVGQIAYGAKRSRRFG